MELPTIRYALERTRQADSTIPAHIHPTWELIYYLDGDGQTVIGETSYEYSSGMLCLIPPETEHLENIRTETHLIFCTFMPAQLKCTAGLYPGSVELTALMHRLVSTASDGGDTSLEIASLYLAIVLLRLTEQNGLSGTVMHVGNRSLDCTLQYISDYYNTDIDLAALAAMVGYSYDRFRHLFRQRYGIPPKQMILLRRIDAAKEQLRRDGSITSIAASCGFSSLSQFTTSFRRATGMTPGEYRAKSICGKK